MKHSTPLKLVMVWAGVGLLVAIRAAEPPQAPLTYEEYRRQSLKEAQPAILEAERAGRHQTITGLVAHFQATGSPGLVRVLAEGGYPAHEIVPVLSSLLQHSNAQAKQWVLAGLRSYGTNAAEATRGVLEVLAGDDELLAAQAAKTIVAIAPLNRAAVPPLVKWMRSGRGDWLSRLAWIGALGEMGTAAAPAVPVLQAELKAEDMPYLTNRTSLTAYSAFNAIGKIRNPAPMPRAELLRRKRQALQGEEAHSAFRTIKDGAVTPEEALPLLHDVLAAPDTPLPQKILAAEMLGEMRPRDSVSIGHLLRATKQSRSQTLADAASAGLVKAAVSDRNSVELLTAALDPQQALVSQAASRALIKAGNIASDPRTIDSVVAALRSCDGRTDFEVVGGFMDVLRALGPKAARAEPVLTGMLPIDAPIYQNRTRSSSMFIRKYTLLTLADVGITAEAIPAIIDELINAPHLENKAAAARAAGALPEGHEIVVPHLQQTLGTMVLTNYASAVNLNVIGLRRGASDSPVTSMPLEIIRALVKMGPAAKPAISVLRTRAQDPAMPAPNYYLPYQAEAARAAEVLSK
jgi:hypothetical protein